MNIEKADFGTIVRFGTLKDFLDKLSFENKELNEILNMVNNDGISLLEMALASRKFDFANYFLSKNARVNVISKENRNELHYIAANINFDGALEVAKILVDKHVDLTLQDLKYKNSPLFSLCMEVLKKRTEEGSRFIVDCLKRIDDYDVANKAGYTIRKLVYERGTDEMKRLLGVE